MTSTSLTPTTSILNAWAWLYASLAFDVLFIIGYGLLGFCLLPSDEKPARRLLTALITADAIEDAVAAAAFGRVAGHQNALYPLTLALHLATVIKWLAALALIARVAYVAWDAWASQPAHLPRWLSALWEQRFSAVIAVLLTVMVAGSGQDVLEQLPGVQRAWPAGRPGWAGCTPRYAPWHKRCSPCC